MFFEYFKAESPVFQFFLLYTEGKSFTSFWTSSKDIEWWLPIFTCSLKWDDSDLRGWLAEKPSEIKPQQASRVQPVWNKVNWVRFVFFYTILLGTLLPSVPWFCIWGEHGWHQPCIPSCTWAEKKSYCSLLSVQHHLDLRGHNQTVITQALFSLPSLPWNAEWCVLSGGSGTRTCVSLYSSTLVSMATIEIAGLLYKLVGEIQNTSPYAAASWNSFSSPGHRLLPSVGLQCWSPLGTSALWLCWAAFGELSTHTQIAPCQDFDLGDDLHLDVQPKCLGECFVPNGSILLLSGCKVNEWAYILACDQGDLCRKATGRT